MIRRKFINILSSALAGLILLPCKLFTVEKMSQDTYSRTLAVRNLAKAGQEFQVRWTRLFKQVYISLNDFAAGLDAGIFTNSSKRKSVLYIGKDKIVFTADNGFVILNDQLYQILYEPFWQEGEIWIPAQLTADFFSDNTAHQMSFNEDKLDFIIGKKNVNISNIKIVAKENGTLIQLFAETTFEEKDITMRVANGWLFVEIFGGKGDSHALSKKIATDLISEIQAIQFDKMLSLAFKLKQDIASRELVLNPDTNDILVNLRLKKVLPDENKVSENLEEQKREWLIDTIVIDPGHGGKDPGAIGHGGVQEKDIVLPVALKLGAIIKEKMPDVKVTFTRTTDEFIPLWRRPQYANEQKGKLFISLHCNSNRSASASGFETYFLSAENDDRARDVVLKENGSIEFEEQEDKKRYEGVNFILATMAQNAFIKQSQYLASVVQKAMGTRLSPLGMEGRGVKQAGFLVMVGATMPNILIETGFVSNKYEAKLLRQKAMQTQIATAIFNGIAKYKNDIENAI